MRSKYNIVLFEPLIPQNTGNIMRTCVAIGANLHLIKPLGFDLDNKDVKRPALDYLKFAKVTVYPSFENFKERNPGVYLFFSRYGKKNYSNIHYNKYINAGNNIYLVFGKETTGIDKHILANNLDYTYRIPTTNSVRSLNLSNCVCMIAYSMMEKLNFPDMEEYEPEIYKGKDFLDNFK